MRPVAGPELRWGEIFARYQTMAVGFARGLVGSKELADDLFQEAVRATLERSRSGAIAFASAEHVRNYLFQVLRNLAADARKARHQAPVELAEEPADPSATPAQRAAADEATARRSQQLATAVAGLPARTREALTLRYLEGLSYKELAARTGKSISTLQARVEAGLERLRSNIGNLPSSQ